MKKILFITFLFNYFLGIGQSPNSASIKGKFVSTDFGDRGYVLMTLKTPITEYQEKVYLVRRFGNWYISSF